MSIKGAQIIFQSGNAATYAGSSVWSDVAEITDKKIPTIEADDIETSHMMSPQQFKEFAPGWADGGELELTIQYDKTKFQTLYNIFRTPRGFRVLFPDAPVPSGTKFGFDGCIK